MTITLFTQKNRPSVAFKQLYSAAKAATLTVTALPVCVLFLKRTAGSGRYVHINDAAHYTAQALLQQLNIKFDEGNAAPRGGLAGDYLLFNAGVFFDAVNRELNRRGLTLHDMEA